MEPLSTTTSSMTRNIIIVLLMLILTILVIVLAVIPQVQELKEKNLRAALLKLELRDKEQSLDNLKELAGALKTQEKEVEKIIQSLPPDPNSEELLIQLNTISGTGEVDLQSVTFSGVEDSDYGSEITGNGGEPVLRNLDFEVSVGGKYSQIYKFAQELAKNIRPLQVRSWELSVMARESNPTVLGRFYLTTYYQQ